MFKHIPNILTIMRFIFIPIILNFIFQGNYILGIIVFTISGLTDVLDGFIARKFNFVSNFGKLMDPLADKLTQISVLAALVSVKISLDFSYCCFKGINNGCWSFFPLWKKCCCL